MIQKSFDIKSFDQQPYLTIPEPEKALFFDIETTGFKPGDAEVYLIGCAYLKDGSYHGIQWLSEGFLDEQRILKEFLAFSEQFTTLIHFNGCMFDVPFIEKTARTYGLECHLSEKIQIDLMKIARKCKAFLCLSGLKQKKIETFLEIQRDDIFNGGELIEVFSEYKRTRDIRLQKVLLLHNADDVRGMLPILSILSFYESAYMLSDIVGSTVQYEVTGAVLDGTIQVPYSFPRRAEFQHESGVLIEFTDSILRFRIPLCEGPLRSYLPHPENYFYLPEEDMVIHKKLASTVDENHKVKATKEQCFVLAKGPFVPNYKGSTLPVFRKDLKDHDTYLLLKDIDILSYISHILSK